MRLLIVSDIHANPWALDAVLRDAGSFDHVLFLGDAVNYGPDPRSAITALRRLDAIGVRGNHDHAVAYGADPRASAAKQAFALSMRDWTRARLDESELTWLTGLPLQMTWECWGTRIAMCHATPHDPLFDYRFVPEIPDSLVAEIVGGVDADVLLLGHTHMPFSRVFGTMTIVNPGSVGQPLDGDPRAAYALWNDGEMRLRRAAYDVEAAVHALRTAAIPNVGRLALMESLRSGRLT